MGTITEIWDPSSNSTPLQWAKQTTGSTPSPDENWNYVLGTTREPTTPSSGELDTYVEVTGSGDANKDDTYNMTREGSEPISSLKTVTQVVVWTYWEEPDSGTLTTIWVKIDGVFYNAGNVSVGGTGAWESVTYTTGAPWDISDFSDFEVRLDSASLGAPDTNWHFLVYAELTGTNYSVDTTTEIIRPNFDGTTTDWQLSTGSDHYALVDDVVTSPTESGTSDYVFADGNDDNKADQFHFEHPQGLYYITSITLYALVQDFDDTGISFHLNINPDGGGWETESNESTSDSKWDWYSNTWSGTTYTAGEMANFQAEISVDGMAGADELRCAVMYALLTGFPHPPTMI